MSQPIERQARDALRADPEMAMPAPDPADTKPRTATAPKPPVADPEAPYGWMRDPKTGETRPKKRPGRQGTKTATPPPSHRPTTQARTRSAPAAGAKDFTGQLAEAGQGIWLLLAGIPTPDKPVRIAGIDMTAISIRAKAQAAVLDQNLGQIVASVNLMAQHSKPVRNAVVRYTADTGPAWVLPAMMALAPFVFQSAMIWRAPVSGDITNLARHTDTKFDEVVKAMSVPPPVQTIMDGMSEGSSVNGEHATSGT
jgi:hypothetical protein